MEEKRSGRQSLLIACATIGLIVLIVLIVQGALLINAVSSLTLTALSAPFNEDYLAQRVGAEVEKALIDAQKERNAPLESCTAELIWGDAAAFAVQLRVKAAPRSFSTKTTAELICGEKTFAMRRQGNAFVGDIPMKLTTGEADYAVLLREGDAFTSQTVHWEKEPDGSLMLLYTEDAYTENIAVEKAVEEMGDIPVRDGAVRLFPGSLPFGDAPVSARLLVRGGGKEVYSMAVPVDGSGVKMKGTPRTGSVFAEVTCASGITCREYLGILRHEEQTADGAGQTVDETGDLWFSAEAFPVNKECEPYRRSDLLLINRDGNELLLEGYYVD
ncbi:MAG: hypothetical protein LBQ33_00415 [Oscillospiraceae bacterium]|jgi:hypothetical protein|nr:hypothetical protein [Oscillospiraceae bacterium]